MDQNRKSMMEPAEGSRETALENERMSSGGEKSGDQVRNRESSARDLGSSSDRAMMTGRGGEERETPSERGAGSSGERNRADEPDHGSNTGGITNRELDRELDEQQQLPERGRSQSER